MEDSSEKCVYGFVWSWKILVKNMFVGLVFFFSVTEEFADKYQLSQSNTRKKSMMFHTISQKNGKAD